MFRSVSHRRIWPALLAAACCALACAAHADGIAHPGQFLDQAEQLRTSDNPRFVQMLAQIHRVAPQLTSAQQWRLRYLDAWETMYHGNYTDSATQLREVAAHSGDPVLAIKADALLLSNLGINRHYQAAFTLANQLTKRLPEVHDKDARLTLLDFLSQTMQIAGQTDLAIKYARMMVSSMPADETPCKPLSMEVSALDSGGKLTSSSPVLQRAIAACVSARQPVFANSLWFVQAGLLQDEGKLRSELALLERIAPSIRHSGYYPHKLWLQAYLAQAYAKLGNASAAGKAALAVLAMARPGDSSWALSAAYEQLYRIAKQQNHTAAALGYYERYIALNKAGQDNANVRALAYQTVQQQVLAQKLETTQLSRQNAVLRMHQALDAKSAETDRLYLALLLAALVFAGFGMYRLKRSQLRFRRLSRLDSLTAISNRQHFMVEAERALLAQEREGGGACMAFIDLDHFKLINDTHGHAVGDAVLRHVVTACRQQLRPADLFGRTGGEEFAILLIACTRAQGASVAERIRQAIMASPVTTDGVAVAVSGSIGLAFTDACGHSLKRLCSEADAALYKAKRGGRNRVASDASEADLVGA